MTPLEQLRAEQHNDVPTSADEALTAFLRGIDPDTARLDLCPHTAIETRMLGRSTAA
jgi:hypothetical protein